jgi:hypothetical protein
LKTPLDNYITYYEIEETIESLLDGQEEIKANQIEMKVGMDSQYDELKAKVDSNKKRN